MKRVSIFLPENLLADLKALADGRPVAELIRQAIVEFIAKLKREQG